MMVNWGRFICLPAFLSEKGFTADSFLLQGTDQTVSLLLEKCFLKRPFRIPGQKRTDKSKGAYVL